MSEAARPLRPELPALPARLTHLPVDDRGYPVPWFVEWVDGKPDHRLADQAKRRLAMRHDRCWICGDTLGRHRAFLLGPMCTVTRSTPEPGMHRECADFAARACPFITRPHAHRRTAGLPEETVEAPGAMLMRNPGVIALWMTQTFHLFTVTRSMGGVPGTLIEVGEPDEVVWLAEGRLATYEEVQTSILSGLPALIERACGDQHPGALEHLGDCVHALSRILSETWPRANVALFEALRLAPGLEALS